LSGQVFQALDVHREPGIHFGTTLVEGRGRLPQATPAVRRSRWRFIAFSSGDAKIEG
jgi:hypothetical protein